MSQRWTRQKALKAVIKLTLDTKEHCQDYISSYWDITVSRLISTSTDEGQI